MLSERKTERYILYRRVLNEFRFVQNPHIFSSDLAKRCAINPAQVRQDFLELGIRGNRRTGYAVRELLDAIDQLLPFSIEQNAIVIGSVELAEMLKDYFDAQNSAISIQAVFLFPTSQKTTDPANSLKLYSIHELLEVCSLLNPSTCIVANIPDLDAIAPILLSTGIKKIINLSPERISWEGFEIVNFDVVLQIEKFIYSKSWKQV